jgi:Bifunctional DNA primase/polymerase, N-terminal
MTPLEIALEYIARGWSPIPIPYKGKAPLDKGWPSWRITKDTAHQWFNGEAQNVGVRLGELSGGLADVDLDSIEAVSAGPCPGHCASGVLPSREAIGSISPTFTKPKIKPRSNSSLQQAAAKTARSR